MSVIKDRVLWLDLETSGSDETGPGAAILELGMVITDWPYCRPVAKENWVFGLNSEELKHLQSWDTVVIDMHSDNKLLAEVLKSRFYTDKLDPVEWIENNIDTAYQMEPGWRIPLGGSGVNHFDRRWIKIWWPELDERLTYWAYDVGVLRRTFAEFAPKYARGDSRKPHRALEDTLLAIEEYKHYTDLIRKINES